MDKLNLYKKIVRSLLESYSSTESDQNADIKTVELEQNGIPKEDIVLAFHAPYKRPYTGYAVA
jgi:hypothetical protein